MLLINASEITVQYLK
ncbi:Protein of unknown function [Lactobacillus delbrueckii subsp. lactis]|nr:Putative uncharacterized protein [Lactobacillus delbrueckii subsp. lactis]CDR81493.1 Protein of unknown function [Lactobacillus delbrueckii subsp. lactis]CDR83001.1 Protein of unknown function [Lactobacillus delbrueckii subsp. lactis]